MAKARTVGRPKISATQKAKNAAVYKSIKKAYKGLKSNPAGLSYVQFKNRVLQQRGTTYKGKKLGTKGAIKRVKGSTIFIAPKERNIINLYIGLRRKFPDIYDQIKNFCRDAKGHYMRPEDHTVWEKESDVYVVTNGKGEQLAISMIRSPETVILTRLS